MSNPDSTALWRLDAAELLSGFSTRRFSPVDVLEQCLAQVHSWQPWTHALVHLDEKGAREQAQASALRWEQGQPQGPLDGVPVSVKDNLHVAGMPTTWGSPLLRGFVSAQDELPVARLRAAGALLFAKTNLPEFAMQGYTGNPVFGTTRNPWNPALTPGGSSGGAAAAVATGCGPLALVTDGGGSARRPAAFTGVVGFKPSGGLIRRSGGLPEIFLSYEVVGAMARSVVGVNLLVHAAGGHALPPIASSPRAQRVLFVPRFARHPVDPHIASLVQQAALQLQALGHEVDEAAEFDLAEEVNALWPVLSQAGLAWMLNQASRFPEFGLASGQLVDASLCGEALQAQLRAGKALSATDLMSLLTAIERLHVKLAGLFERYDFILTPCAAALPWAADQTHPEHIDGQLVGPRGHGVFTALANAAGLPAISLPCGQALGLPVGLQLIGAPGTDAQLLALARQFEIAHPWQHQWPCLPDPDTQ